LQGKFMMWNVLCVELFVFSKLFFDNFWSLECILFFELSSL
jgi:hypothetical protein